MKLLATLTVFTLSLGLGAPVLRTAQVAAKAEVRRTDLSQEYGRNVGRGNLLGIQVYLKPTDYRSAGSFFASLDAPLARARRKGWINRKTIIIFPEAIGLFLMAANEKPAVYAAHSVPDAMSLILENHQSEIAGERLAALKSDPIQGRRIVQELKAPLMARVYQGTFSKLARRYRATIVAGSIMLPGPAIRHGALVSHVAGPVQNVCAVFRPNGALYPDLVVKAYPVVEEVQSLGVVRGKTASLPVFSTPAGKLGVAICADAWFPESYRVLESKGAEFLAVPSLSDPMAVQRWTGYSLSGGFEAPADAVPADVGNLTLYQATVKYSTPGRLEEAFRRSSRIHQGMTVFMRGGLWDVKTSDSAPLVTDHGKFITRELPSQGPTTACFWLR